MQLLYIQICNLYCILTNLLNVSLRGSTKKMEQMIFLNQLASEQEKLHVPLGLNGSFRSVKAWGSFKVGRLGRKKSFFFLFFFGCSGTESEHH